MIRNVTMNYPLVFSLPLINYPLHCIYSWVFELASTLAFKATVLFAVGVLCCCNDADKEIPRF